MTTRHPTTQKSDKNAGGQERAGVGFLTSLKRSGLLFTAHQSPFFSMVCLTMGFEGDLFFDSQVVLR